MNGPSWMVPLVLFALLAAAFAQTAPKPEPYKSKADISSVDFLRLDWHDAKRDRDVPVKIYFPKTDPGPFPVIIFSHGLGGSREGYEYLGRHWASCGYVSVHLQHIGSDESVWLGIPPADRLQALKDSLRDPHVSGNRIGDVSFAIDQLENLNRDPGPLKSRLDLARIGMAGHSFGAWTTLAVSGQTFLVGGKDLSLAEPRIKAAVAMSPAAQGVPKDRLDRAFSSIHIPMLHLTGTLDQSPINDTAPADRRVPYDHISAADQFLIIFQGGDHMVFSGRASGLLRALNPKVDPAKDPIFQDLILQSTTAFWDAYLKSDPKSKTWLTTGALKSVLNDNATLEIKLKK